MMRRGIDLRWWLIGLLLLAAGGAVFVASQGTVWLVVYFLILTVVGWGTARRLAKGLESLRLPSAHHSAEEDEELPDAHPVREIRELACRLGEARREIHRVFQSQRDFTAHAAHELRTPLAALRVAGESALRSDQEDALRDALGGMLEEAERTERVIDRLLLLARAESGQMEVRPKQWLLSDLIEPVVELLEPLAEAKGQRILRPEMTDWSVFCDAELFRLVLENLLSNAIRHSGENTEIAVQVSRWPTGGVAIDVVDDGPGVPPGDEERIFDPFHRGRGASAAGTGLGLPIARWAADAFGGKVVFERRLGHGAVFRLLCPETEWDHFESAQIPEVQGIEEEWATSAPPSQLMIRLGVTRAGLPSYEAAQRGQRHGKNTVRHGEESHPLLRLWRVLLSPFNGVLAISICLSLLLGEGGAAAVMTAMVILGTALRFWQESRAHGAIRALERSIRLESLVSRPEVGAPVAVAVEDLVPGDIVHLRAGDMVPADLRLLSCDGLEVSEATFTGESGVVKKSATSLGDFAPAVSNICYFGTHVAKGTGTGVVFATGSRTRLNDLTHREERRRPPGPFEQGVRQVSLALLSFMAVLVPVVFFINGALKGNWTEALLFGLAAAIGLTPELLPMIVNVNLARAATALSRRGVIFRFLPAVQELGSIDVLCLEPTNSSGRVAEDLKELRRSGIQIVLVSAEPLDRVRSLAQEADVSTAKPMTGAEVSGLSDEALAGLIKTTGIFSEMGPLDKARVVAAFRENGARRVGFFGHGADDAKALREADVGIVASSAAALSRECAEVVLSEEQLGILVEAIQEGRTAFGNILKYIKITASSNLGNAVSVVLASLILPFLPMRAVQLLAQNLLYDLTQFLLPWDRVDEKFRRHPRAWSSDSIVRFMLVFGPVSCIFDLLTFAVIWWGIGAQSPEQAALFHTGWFTVGLLTQLMIVHVLRTGNSVWQSPPATAPVVLATFLAAIVGVALPHTPIAPLLGFDLLPAWFFAWVAFVLLAYATTAELVKRWYVRKSGQWL